MTLRYEMSAEMVASLHRSRRYVRADGQAFQMAGGDIPESGVPDGEIAVYHTHGKRQYMGTAKLHITPECPPLVYWKPETHIVNGEAKSLSKTIMVELMTHEDAKSWAMCKRCSR